MEGRLRLPWRWGSRRLGVLSFLFLSLLSWCAVLFLFCLAELERRRSGSPARTDHFSLGRDWLKAEKWAAVREGSGKPLP